GRPPMPSAMSSSSEPVPITSAGSTLPSPMRITEPLPNCFSIWPSAAESARFLFSSIVVVLVMVNSGWVHPCRRPSQGLRRRRQGQCWSCAGGPAAGRWRPPLSENPAPPSPAGPHQAAVQALDGEVLVRLHLDRRMVGVARQQADAVAADLQQLDRDRVVHARDHDLAAARVAGAVHADQVAL